MGNPRIVSGKDGSTWAVRGHVGDDVFSLKINGDEPDRRVDLEDRMLDEARSLIARARNGPFRWADHGFLENEFGVWERVLTPGDLEKL